MRRDRSSQISAVSTAIAIALITAACVGGGGTTAPSSIPEPTVTAPTSTPVPTAAPTRVAAATPSADPSLIARSFDIGDDRTLYLECVGTGSPTILLEAGDESDMSQWSLVKGPLGRETRTCAYERAGVRRSPTADGCRDMDDILGDLEALLKAADVPGPYVLVGTSGGGFLMVGFAARHPDDVAGLVLVETPKAITIISPELRALIACDAPTNIEHRDYFKVEHAAWDDRKKIGDFPLTVISNDYGADALPNDDQQTNVPDQKGWLVLSPNSKQIVVTTGHNVPGDQPDLVVREILAVLKAAGNR